MLSVIQGVEYRDIGLQQALVGHAGERCPSFKDEVHGLWDENGQGTYLSLEIDPARLEIFQVHPSADIEVSLIQPACEGFDDNALCAERDAAADIMDELVVIGNRVSGAFDEHLTLDPGRRERSNSRYVEAGGSGDIGKVRIDQRRDLERDFSPGGKVQASMGRGIGPDRHDALSRKLDPRFGDDQGPLFILDHDAACPHELSFPESEAYSRDMQGNIEVLEVGNGPGDLGASAQFPPEFGPACNCEVRGELGLFEIRLNVHRLFARIIHALEDEIVLPGDVHDPSGHGETDRDVVEDLPLYHRGCDPHCGLKPRLPKRSASRGLEHQPPSGHLASLKRGERAEHDSFGREREVIPVISVQVY